jgi:hypothetical protein
MAKTILDEHQAIAAERQIIAILQSPQGRELGRWFLTEIGKGDAGNMPQLKKELFDIFSRKINDLYAAPRPIESTR